MTRACEGVVFDSMDTVKKLVSKTSTQTGLKVTVSILDKTYKAGRKVAEKLKSTLNIVNDKVLPAWNYTISPQVT